MTGTSPELSVVFTMASILVVLAYMSLEMRDTLYGLPVLFTGFSVASIVLWQLELFQPELVWLVFIIHGITLGLAAVTD